MQPPKAKIQTDPLPRVWRRLNFHKSLPHVILSGVPPVVFFPFVLLSDEWPGHAVEGSLFDLANGKDANTATHHRKSSR